MKKRFSTIFNQIKRYCHYLLCALLSFHIIFNSQAAILQPEGSADLVRLIVSKFNHTLMPKGLTHILSQIEKNIEAKGGNSYKAYKIYKNNFSKYVYPAIGHSSWIVGTHLPFIGTDALNIPAVAGYTISQVITNQLLTDDAIFTKTFDLKIKGGGILSVSFDEEQLIIRESIHSKVKGFLIENDPITYSKEDGYTYVHLNKDVLKLHEDESHWFGISYQSLEKNITEENLKNFDIIEAESDRLVTKILVNDQGRILKRSLWPRMFEKVFPDYRSTFDIKLIDGSIVSVYFSKNNMQIKESMYNSTIDFIKSVKRVDGDLVIIIDNVKLGIIDPEISDTFIIGLKKPKEKKAVIKRLNNSDNYKSDRDLLASFSIESKKGKAPIAETFINNNGTKTFWKKLSPITKIFNLQLNGITSQSTTFADAMQRFTRILVTANISWPMFEIGRQFYTNSGVLNFTPMLTHSYGLFSSFIVGGITGAALGSRIIDLGYVLNHQAKNYISYKIKTRPIGKISAPILKVHCATLINQVFLASKNSKMTLDLAREILIKSWGWKYNTLSTSLGIVFGGIGAFAAPTYYQKGSNYLRLAFGGTEEQKFESLNVKNDYSKNYKRYVEGEEKILPDDFFLSKDNKKNKLENIFETTFLSFSSELSGELKTLRDKLSDKKTTFDVEKMISNRKHDAKALLKTVEKLKNDPKAQKDLYFLIYLFVQPIEDLKKHYLKKINKIQDFNELNIAFNGFLKDAHLEKHRKASRTTVFNNTNNNLNKAIANTISFISLSDVLIYDRLLNELEKK